MNIEYNGSWLSPNYYNQPSLFLIVHGRYLATVKMFDSYGHTMVDINKLKRKNDDLVLEGKMLNSMPGEFYIRPEEVWSAGKLLSWAVIRYLPIMLIKGWRRSKRSSQPKLKAQNRM